MPHPDPKYADEAQTKTRDAPIAAPSTVSAITVATASPESRDHGEAGVLESLPSLARSTGVQL